MFHGSHKAVHPKVQTEVPRTAGPAEFWVTGPFYIQEEAFAHIEGGCPTSGHMGEKGQGPPV